VAVPYTNAVSVVANYGESLAGFARVDSGRPHPDQYLAVSWLAQLDVFDPQDVESAVVVETHCSYDVNPFKG
jgi:hypothetical protein